MSRAWKPNQPARLLLIRGLQRGAMPSLDSLWRAILKANGPSPWRSTGYPVISEIVTGMEMCFITLMMAVGNWSHLPSMLSHAGIYRTCKVQLLHLFHLRCATWHNLKVMGCGIKPELVWSLKSLVQLNFLFRGSAMTASSSWFLGQFQEHITGWRTEGRKGNMLPQQACWGLGLWGDE